EKKLASKRIITELNKVLTTALKTINFIKSYTLNSQLVSMLLVKMGSTHKMLLQHTRVR
ncbi:Uncharacterized protein FWK35_00022836, partial [Aphis craccivora]